MLRRQIPAEWVERIMANPDQIIGGLGQRQIYQSRMSSEGKHCLVRLVVEGVDPLVVVTVYRTSKIDKY